MTKVGYALLGGIMVILIWFTGYIHTATRDAGRCYEEGGITSMTTISYTSYCVKSIVFKVVPMF